LTKTVLVVGCGSIGRRHIGNLTKLGCRVTAFDPDASRARWAAGNLGCETVASLEEGLNRKPGAVWICTPPSLHAAVAVPALRRGVDCFIEKPLAHDLPSAGAIAAAAKRGRARVAVGYQLRAHPGLRWLKKTLDSGKWGRLLFLRAQLGQYLPDWRPWQDYRKSYTARRELGGGIILDGSHELDLALWLGGRAEAVYCRARRLSRLDVNVEDTAALTLDFADGALGEVHLDMVSRAYRRGLELSCERATVLWDQPTGTARVYSPKTKKWTVRRFELDYNDLYSLESAAFLKKGAEPRAASLQEGRALLAAVDAAMKSARTGRRERIKK